MDDPLEDSLSARERHARGILSDNRSMAEKLADRQVPKPVIHEHPDADSLSARERHARGILSDNRSMEEKFADRRAFSGSSRPSPGLSTPGITKIPEFPGSDKPKGLGR